MTVDHPVADRYLDQLDDALREIAMAPRDRHEIALEIESHLAEAIRSGQNLADVLRRLGGPAALAQAYAVEQILRPRRLPANWLGRLARAATAAAAVVALLLGAAVGCAWTLSGLAIALAALLGPLLPLTTTVRAGAPQFILLLAGVALGALGALLLRFVFKGARLFIVSARAGSRQDDPLPQPEERN